ncbi:MAG: hypothetical protein HZC24_12385 [Rhodocyclales bacterium]|nr:hypothetical protein [Rhodocyclales bacterium]
MNRLHWRPLLLALSFVLPAATLADGRGAAPRPFLSKSTPFDQSPGEAVLKRWASDFGILGGRCDGAGTSAVDGRRSAAARLVGAVRAPSSFGHAGRSIDSIDRRCIGQTLELAPSRHTVRWTNAYSQAAYAVTPMRATTRNGTPCREFSGLMKLDGRDHLLHGTACRSGEGLWQVG